MWHKLDEKFIKQVIDNETKRILALQDAESTFSDTYIELACALKSINIIERELFKS